MISYADSAEARVYPVLDTGYLHGSIVVSAGHGNEEKELGLGGMGDGRAGASRAVSASEGRARR